MRLTRVFIDQPLRAQTRLTLPEDAAGHLVRVLRLREGDTCLLFNGDGNDYQARLLTTNKRGVEVELLEGRAIDNESPLRITLLQGIARGEKMDMILQKATELGVIAIMPVFAERTEVRLDGERLHKRTQHWRNVIIAACEQSGRARIPSLSPPLEFSAAIAAIEGAPMRLLLDPVGDLAFATLPIMPTDGVVIAIGPEGGWSPNDRELLRQQGFHGLRLGPRVLRTETAGLAAIAALQTKFGDL